MHIPHLLCCFHIALEPTKSVCTEVAHSRLTKPFVPSRGCPVFIVAAGVATIAPILEATVEDWDWTMNVSKKDETKADEMLRDEIK